MITIYLSNHQYLLPQFFPNILFILTLGKFEGVSKIIGTSMKSVGEVMGIGRTWEESLQKALRMVDPGIKGFESRGPALTKEEAITEFHKPTDKRVFAIAQMLETGMISPLDITLNTSIDPWMISRLKQISDYRNFLKGKELLSIDKPTMVSD